MITINHQITVHDIQDLSNIAIRHGLIYEKIFDIRVDPLFILDNLENFEFQMICNFINQCINLESIYLPNINLILLENMYRLQLLYDSVRKCNKLELLNLSGLNIENVNSFQFEKLSAFISSFTKLRTLNLSWLSLRTLNLKNVQIMCNAIIESPNLQTVNLVGAGLDELNAENFKAICNMILKCKHLKTLELHQIELEDLEPTHFNMLCDTINKSLALVCCSFEFKQDDMCKRNQIIEQILQKKQVSIFHNIEMISYFSTKHKSKSPCCGKRTKEEFTVSYDEAATTYLPKKACPG